MIYLPLQKGLEMYDIIMYDIRISSVFNDKNKYPQVYSDGCLFKLVE